MGNVHAASATTRSSMGFQPPVTILPRDDPLVASSRSSIPFQPPPTSISQDNLPANPIEPNFLGNPGTMEELHKMCKEIFPINFEGAKLMLNKGLSSHFQISHTINMSSIMPSGYKFGATYVGTKQISPTDTFPVLVGDIDPTGNLNANVIHQFTDRIRGKLATQVQRNKFNAVQMTADYRGDYYTLSLTLGNPDIINNSGLIVVHYLQNITKNLALGAEFLYQQGPTLPTGYISLFSAAARYINGNSTISGSIGSAGCHVCYYQKASQQVQVGVEFEVSSRMQEAITTIGYQVDLPKADIIFKGSVDSNWTISGLLEKKLQPLPFSFSLSGVLNHNKNHFRLGCGLLIG